MNTPTEDQPPSSIPEDILCKQQTFKNGTFKTLTGYELSNFTSQRNFTKWLNRPVDGAALGIFRLLYGAFMLIDLAEERGGGQMDVRFGEPLKCHFPLFNFIKAFSYPVIGCLYILMWLGAIGIMLGYHFHLSCMAYIIPYWYIFLLDKPSWNNHSYLFGLIGFLLSFTKAHHYCSLDKSRKRLSTAIPYWNYFLIKFQFFILYLYAGLKKLSPEWLAGYAMASLSHHWVLLPFHWFLSPSMIDLLIVHWFTAIFDFSIAFFMTCHWSRKLATPFMILFHLMNSRLFVIGMFPWVCLAGVPLFYNYDWPRHITIRNMRKFFSKSVKANIPNGGKHSVDTTEPLITTTTNNETVCAHGDGDGDANRKNDLPKKYLIRTWLILIYCGLQLFLPYSHFLTPGYNNWTRGLYGYSWDMMVHSYEILNVQIRIIDNANNKEHHLEPYAFTEYDRWTKYADMAQQYAQCIYKNMEKMHKQELNFLPITSLNLSIYIDVWCSMNGRLMQRVFDPTVDLLQVDWSPFKKASWSLPLLEEFKYMRPKLLTISNDVYEWNNATDVIIVADYPGLTLENIIPNDIINTSITILEGNVRFKEMDSPETYYLTAGKSISIMTPIGYQVTTMGLRPSIYMITYTNQTMLNQSLNSVDNNDKEEAWLPLWQEFQQRLNNYKTFLKNMANCILYLVYGVPIPLKIRQLE